MVLQLALGTGAIRMQGHKLYGLIVGNLNYVGQT